MDGSHLLNESPFEFVHVHTAFDWKRGGFAVKEVHVGLIGYGLSGAVFHAPLISSVQGLVLQKVVSSNPDKVRRDFPDVAVVPDAAALWSDPEIEVVVVASPNTTHFAYAKQALQADKHVIVEKPFVNCSKEADELIRLAEQRKLWLSVFQNRRWDNDFRTVKTCIQEGLLGDIFTYEAHYDRFRPRISGKWKERELAGSGVLYDLGAHLIDQALHLFGMPDTVSADVLKQRPAATIDDYFHLVLSYGRLRVILHAGCLVKKAGPHFQVHGSKGSLITYGFDPQEEDLKRGLRPDHPAWGEGQGTGHAELTLGTELNVNTRLAIIPGCYQAYYQGIYDAVVKGTPLPVSAAEARNTVRVIEYAVQSSNEQRTIVLQNEESS